MKKRLLGITAAFLVMVCCFVVGGAQMIVPEGVIVNFSYAEIKDELQPAVGNSTSDGIPYVNVTMAEQSVKSDKLRLEGVILVVKVGTSKNILRSVHVNTSDDRDEMPPEAMDLAYNKTYNYNEVNLNYASHVETQVEILDVFFQTEGANFKKGQTATVYEPYYIMDQRITGKENVTDGTTSKIYRPRMGLCGSFPYYPLQEGHTYVIFGVYGKFKDGTAEENAWYELRHGKNTISMSNVYCLSAGIGAGNIPAWIDRVHHLEYIRDNYDVDKYMN